MYGDSGEMYMYDHIKRFLRDCFVNVLEQERLTSMGGRLDKMSMLWCFTGGVVLMFLTFCSCRSCPLNTITLCSIAFLYLWLH